MSEFNTLPRDLQTIINHIRYCGVAPTPNPSYSTPRWNAAVSLAHGWIAEYCNSSR